MTENTKTIAPAVNPGLSQGTTVTIGMPLGQRVKLLERELEALKAGRRGG